MKIRRIIRLVEALLAAGMLVVIVRAIIAPREYVYENLTARQWLAEVFTTNQVNAFMAFQVLGTNALPVVVETFTERESAWDHFYQKNYPNLPEELQKHLTAPTPIAVRWSAASLVLMNNAETRMVMPELARMLGDKDNCAHVYILPCLACRMDGGDTNYIPLLVQCLSETNANERAQAAADLEQFGPAAKSAVPMLTGLLNDPASGGRGFGPAMEAAYALWKIDGQTNVPTQVLRKYLATGDLYTRNRVAVYLSDVNPGDLSLIPSIVGAVTNHDQFMERRAAIALGQYRVGAENIVPDLVKMLDSGTYHGVERRLILRSLEKLDLTTAANYEEIIK